MKALDIRRRNRWLLFSGLHYYPQGGILDFKGVFNSLGDSLIALKGRLKDEWAHIVPLREGNPHLLRKRDGKWYRDDEAFKEPVSGICRCECNHALGDSCTHEFRDFSCVHCGLLESEHKEDPWLVAPLTEEEKKSLDLSDKEIDSW